MSRSWLIAALAAVLALGAGPAAALQFSATLDSIRVEARPGETINRSFLLRLAPDEQATRFHSHVEDFWQSEDGTRSFYQPPGTLERSCGPWVTLNPVEREVEAGGVLDVRLTVTVPTAAGPGGYWCALTVDQIADPMAASDGVDVRFLASISVGIFVYLAPIEREVRVLEVEVGAESARLRVANQGNAPVAVEGRFEFLHPETTDAAAIVPLPRTTLLLEPIASRWIAVPLPDPSQLPTGRYLVRTVIDIGLDHYVGVQREMEVHRAADPAAP